MEFNILTNNEITDTARLEEEFFKTFDTFTSEEKAKI